MKHGDLSWLEEIVRERGGPVPDILKQKPDLFLGLDVYYVGFNDLSTCRPYPGMPIPWKEIVSYCKHYGIEYEELFHNVIREMDNEYLKIVQENQEKRNG